MAYTSIFLFFIFRTLSIPLLYYRTVTVDSFLSDDYHLIIYPMFFVTFSYVLDYYFFCAFTLLYF